MRVLIAPHHFGPMLPPALGAQALARGWREERPDDEVRLHPLSDGTSGFLQTVPGTTEILMVATPGGEVPVPVVRDGSADQPWRTVYCHTDALRTEQPLTAEHFIDASSAPVGDMLLQIIARGAKKIVIGAGKAPWHDAGAGLLARLAGEAATRGAPDLQRRMAGSIDPALADVLPDVRGLLTGITIVVASARDLPLRGLSGAGADLAEQRLMTPAQAQTVENATADFAAAVDAAVQAEAHQSLLGGDSTPASRRPFLGAGGGAAYILAALGARVFQGPQVVSTETDFPSSLTGMELALTGAQVIAGAELGHGVTAHVAAMAAAHAIPTIAVAGRIDASRGQLFKAGITSAYPVTDISSARPAVTAPPVTEDALIERGRRLAKTWSR